MSNPEAAIPGALPGLVRDLEDLELSPYEARSLLSLMQLGTATSLDLARHSRVPRTSTYQVMEELTLKGLAQRLSVEGPAMWASPGRNEVLDRLNALHEERFHNQVARTERVRELLATTLPDEPSSGTPYVHVIQGAAQVARIYDRLLAGAEREVLVFNRAPYSQEPAWANPVVLATMERGVEARALYERAHWTNPKAAAFRQAMHQYHRAGVRGALVDALPIKLAIADRKVALLAITDPLLPDMGFPTTLLVEHPGFAAVQAHAFDHLWSAAEPVVVPA